MRWIRLLSAGAPLASNREDLQRILFCVRAADDKKNLHDEDPSFDINEFKKFVKGAKKTVMEKALVAVEESRIEEKGNGGQESQVEDATASIATAVNTVPSATTKTNAKPNGDTAVPADNAIAPPGESTGSNGGLDNKSDAALAENEDDDDDGDFPMANDDDDDDASNPDQEAQLIANTHARYNFTTSNLKKTAPLYNNHLLRLLEETNNHSFAIWLSFIGRLRFISLIQ